MKAAVSRLTRLLHSATISDGRDLVLSAESGQPWLSTTSHRVRIAS